MGFRKHSTALHAGLTGPARGFEVKDSRTSAPESASTLPRAGVLPPVKVITVTGGKGGVGKTNVAANLGVSLAAGGNNVMLLDADFGMASVDVLLGLHPRFNLAHVLSGECRLEKVLVDGPHGMKIVPSASGVRGMARLSCAEHAGLIRAFSDLDSKLDILIVDTAAGLSDSVITFSHAAHHVLVVVCDEPASITSACALINVLAGDHGLSRFQVLANQTRSPEEGQQLFDRVARICERNLAVSLEFLGAIPHDEHVRLAVRRQIAVVDAYPASPAANAFRSLAAKASQWTVPQGARGHLEFFIERLVQAGTARPGDLQ